MSSSKKSRLASSQFPCTYLFKMEYKKGLVFMLSREPWICGSGVISCWRSIDFGSQEWRDGLHVPNAVGWELNRGKIGDGSSPKENDKSVEEFLLAPLRALDKLPVNLHALQTCNVGKSVNHLCSHKNSEIKKKARSLVDTWKKPS